MTLNTSTQGKRVCAVVAAAVVAACPRVAAAGGAADYTSYVNVVQNANGMYGLHDTALLRYPSGRIGLWSIDKGEIADSVARGLQLYPCVDSVVIKDKSDWRKTITGDPSVVNITYRDSVAAKGSSVALTVTPHVSCYRYHFAPSTNYQAVALTTLDDGGLFSWDKNAPRKWTNNTVHLVDDRSVELTVSGAKQVSVYYYIRFSRVSIGSGTFHEGTIHDASRSVTGDRVGAFLKFRAPEVTVAVAVSHTSMAQARAWLEEEFASLDFGDAAERLKRAWTATLGKVEAQGSFLRMRQLYTALYTVFVNVIDASDNPFYRSRKPLLTIGSSDFWQYIGGYMRCDWDMSRGVYSLLSLIDPGLFSHILNSYQAQYDRDGKFLPNWDPFWASGFRESLYLANFATLARQAGVSGVDYARLKDSLTNHVQRQYQSPFFINGYVPAEAADASPASRTLEYCTQLQGLAILARTLGDTATYDRYYRYRTNYMRLYDPENQQFRVRMANGQWGPIGKKFFEGSGIDYGFCAPHDPYGLLALYGPGAAVSKIEAYMKKKSDFNDYQLIYEFLPVFADRADVAADIVRTSHIPKFDTLIMSEGLWPGSKGCYYTDNAGPLACCLLGMYWIPTSGGTWVLTAPSLDRVVIHGKKTLTIHAEDNSPENHFISSIRKNGEAYPCFLISAATLAGSDQTLSFALTNRPVRLRDLYLSSADGDVLEVTADDPSHLSFTIDPLATSCTAQVYSRVEPASIILDGVPFKNWTYDPATRLATLRDVTRGSYRVIAGVEKAASPARGLQPERGVR